ncbi:MAG: TonB-dependent receptor [Chitinophagaceae bacterium]|nr:TonB-dependent receptor [Chitinophagaceae bacterium]
MNFGIPGKAMHWRLPSKLLFIMKMCTILLLTTALHVSARTYSQKVTLSEKKITIERAFKIINKQTGVEFIYKYGLFKKMKPVDINVHNSPVGDVINLLLKDAGLSYTIRNNIIVIRSKREVAGPQNDVTNEEADNMVSVKGTVKDQKGAPLVGISVVITGKAGGTTTNEKGEFSIDVERGDELVLSGVGYVTQKIKVGAQTTLAITMPAADNQLDDIVVIGYSSQQRKHVTGAITSVKIEGSPKATVPFINPLEALQGTAGINVGPSARSGAQPSILVRGQNSITANTNPLIVLDGVIFNGNLNEINMNDVASFDVLKDASSAAIYGSRSANGVVIITTKRGKTDKPKINLSTYYGAQWWTRRPTMRGPEGFLEWRKNNLGQAGVDTSDMTKVLTPMELKAYNEGHTMDWMKDITQDAPIQNYEISVSGRTSNLNYYFSAAFLDQKGVIYNDNYKKPTLTLKLENNITSWLSYGINGYYSSRDYSGLSPDLYMATYMSPFSYKYVEGTDILQRFPAQTSSLFNPYWRNPSVSELGYYDDDMEKYSSIRGTGFLNVKLPFIKGLNYRFNLTASRATTELGSFHHEFGEVNTLVPEQIANPSQFLARAWGSRSGSATNSWLLDNLLTYNRSFGDHSVDALLGYTRDRSQSNTESLNGSNFANIGTTSMGFYGLQYATTYSVNTSYSMYANVGYIGRLGYGYREKYFVTFNFRRDGYSAFTEGNKFGNFPGVSVAWNVSNEKFLGSQKWIDFLKLRLSYGKTGNQGISPYATRAQIGTGFTVFGNTSTQFTTPSTLGNKMLTWETTTALNLGINFAVLNNRLSGYVDVYKSNTKDQLIARAIPIMTGYNTVNTNRGEVGNKGIEIGLNSVNISSARGFRWETGVNFWLNRNRLLHLNGLDADGDGREDDDIGNSWFIGKSLGAIYDYTFDGIVQTSDTEYKNSTGFIDGDVKFKDISGPDGKPDGKITTHDRSIVGYAKENFSFNISNTFSYKNFSLYFSFNAIIGGGKNNFFLATNPMGLNPGALLPTVANWLDQPYWTASNPNNEHPRSNYTNPYAYRFWQSRSFGRLQNLSLSYNVPQPLTDRLKISNLRVYVSGTNLFTISGWTGLDPANAAQIGVVSSTPVMRALTFGLNVGF